MEKKLNHVAIIMDGNGRWATKRGLKRSLGHKAGADTLKKVSEYIFNKGINVLSVFAFSTENWKRDKEEVDYLMDLFIKMFKNNFNEIKKNGIKVVFSGIKDKLNDKVLESMKKLEDETKDNNKGIFNICLNYGGRSEIVEASKKIAKDAIENKLDIDNITEDKFEDYLFNDLPPIDLVIRTSGEYRISNFMLWQMAYAELYFTDTYFPDFNEDEFDKAVAYFNNKERRFGGVIKK